MWLVIDTCIYIFVHVGKGNQEPRVDVNITVNCLNSNYSIVSWEAPPNSLLNLQYSCFWSENNTRVSYFITVIDCCYYKSCTLLWQALIEFHRTHPVHTMHAQSVDYILYIRVISTVNS